MCGWEIVRGGGANATGTGFTLLFLGHCFENMLVHLLLIGFSVAPRIVFADDAKAPSRTVDKERSIPVFGRRLVRGGRRVFRVLKLILQQVCALLRRRGLTSLLVFLGVRLSHGAGER